MLDKNKVALCGVQNLIQSLRSQQEATGFHTLFGSLVLSSQWEKSGTSLCCSITQSQAYNTVSSVHSFTHLPKLIS